MRIAVFVTSLHPPLYTMMLRWGKFIDLQKHGKTGAQKEHHKWSRIDSWVR